MGFRVASDMNTQMCFSIGTPKTIKFPFVTKWIINGYKYPNILAYKGIVVWWRCKFAKILGS